MTDRLILLIASFLVPIVLYGGFLAQARDDASWWIFWLTFGVLLILYAKLGKKTKYALKMKNLFADRSLFIFTSLLSLFLGFLISIVFFVIPFARPDNGRLISAILVGLSLSVCIFDVILEFAHIAMSGIFKKLERNAETASMYDRFGKRTSVFFIASFGIVAAFPLLFVSTNLIVAELFEGSFASKLLSMVDPVLCFILSISFLAILFLLLQKKALKSNPAESNLNNE